MSRLKTDLTSFAPAGANSARLSFGDVYKRQLLPARADFKPPLLREHRLYQADWLLRFYGFKAQELLDETHPDFNPLLLSLIHI